jgi:hypothetical protein
MDLVLNRKKAEKFVAQMEILDRKFVGYITVRLSDHVKLNISDGRLVLDIPKTLPEMVKIACNIAFVDAFL